MQMPLWLALKLIALAFCFGARAMTAFAVVAAWLVVDVVVYEVRELRRG